MTGELFDRVTLKPFVRLDLNVPRRRLQNMSLAGKVKTKRWLRAVERTLDYHYTRQMRDEVDRAMRELFAYGSASYRIRIQP